MLDTIQQYNLEFPKDLIANIYQLKDEATTKLRSNVLGWQSPQYSTTENIPWIDNFLKECLSVANLTKKLSALWFNISPTHAHHTWHSHGKVTTIGIFYIQIPNDSGNIEFRQNDIIHSITPYNGLLLIAPGGTDHRVLANKSNEDRISMAFNLDT